jgi:hypothetical protein
MKTKVKISELQPTDTLRKEQIEFFSKLNIEEILSLNPQPQIWDIDGWQIVTDGNNRLGYLSKQEIEYLEFEKIDKEIAERYGFPLEEEIKRAEELMNQGVYSLKDLWKTYQETNR